MSKTYWGIPPIKVKKGPKTPGPNASHRITGIYIWDSIWHPAATLMQEIREWWYLRAKGALYGFPLLAGSTICGWKAYEQQNPDMAVVAVLLALAAFVGSMIGPRTRKNLQEMELMGHATECVVAVEYYGYEFGRVLFMETMSLRGYAQFKGVDEDEIGERLLAACDEARKWVRKNPALISLWVKRLPDIS